MKSLTKKALSLAMAMAMAGSFAVSAAGVTITNDIEKPEATTVAVDIALGTDLTADSQVTMIAYKVADAEGNAINGGEPGESNIVYINQFAATDLSTGFDGTAEAAVTQEFIMRDGEDFVVDGKIVPGTYKIMFGWTGVAAGEAAEATLVVTEDTATIILGDANDNGEVDANDAVCIMRHLAEAGYVIPNATNADVNTSEGIDANDAVCVMRYLAEAGFTFPKAAQ